MENIENFSFEYSLSKDDYLNLNLFDLSQNKKFMKRRFRFKIILCFLILTIPIIISIIYDFQWTFILIWIIISFFVNYNVFFGSNSKFISILEKSIEEKYSNVFGKNYYYEFFDSYLFSKYDSSESKISYHDLNIIKETQDYFFVELKTKNYLIFPKTIFNFEKIKSNLIAISKNYNIIYKEDLNWKFN